MKMMDSFKVFTSVVIGATAGAIVGYLLAPGEGKNDPGKEISKKADKFADQMKRIINDYNNDIKKHLESVKKEAGKLTGS